MRALILTTVALLVGGPALASSIETVGGTAPKNGSVVSMTCVSCPPPKTKEEISSYRVPSLPAGTQAVEIREINGKKTLVRTEAWMGGSPVTYVSSSPMWLDDKGTALAGTQLENGGDGIDVSAQTSAVAGPVAEPATLDVSKFELRLN